MADQAQLNLPKDYDLVGQITMDEAALMSLIAKAAAPVHNEFIAKMQASGSGFGWVMQDAQRKTVVVSFRGTADVEDWLHDFDFLPDTYKPVAKYGTVHQGFQLVYLAIAGSVMTLLRKAKGSMKRLILTGHSLGAALSELAAPDVLHNSGIGVPPEVQNFAGPRAGHHDFASLFDVEIDVCFRIVNVWDIVPHLPPPLALFEHVGMAVKVDGGFTPDELVAHSLEKSYGPGLQKLIPPLGALPKAITAITNAAIAFPNEPLIGREQ